MNLRKSNKVEIVFLFSIDWVRVSRDGMLLLLLFLLLEHLQAFHLRQQPL